MARYTTHTTNGVRHSIDVDGHVTVLAENGDALCYAGKVTQGLCKGSNWVGFDAPNGAPQSPGYKLRRDAVSYLLQQTAWWR